MPSRHRFLDDGLLHRPAIVAGRTGAKAIVAELAFVIEGTDRHTLHKFIENRVIDGAKVYSDNYRAYRGMIYHKHESVRHSSGEYVRGEVHTQGIESFWSMLKRAHMGTFHKISPKHMRRYVTEFSGRHNNREVGTGRQMRDLVRGMVGRRLKYDDLTR